MKIRYFKFVIAMLMCQIGLNSYADKAGNGGDICEDRIKIIRDDIQSWITGGGSAGLDLTNSVSHSQYVSSMLEKLMPGLVSIKCTDDKVMIGSAEKTCKNFVDLKGTNQILCNTGRFMNTADSSQYVLVHHEYAGLADLEVNDGEESKYVISNQISDYLEDEIVKRLAIKKLPAPRHQNIKANFGAFVGHYKMISCSVQSTELGPNKICKYKNAALYFEDIPGVDLVFQIGFSNLTSAPTPDYSVIMAHEMEGDGYTCSTFYGKQYCLGRYMLDISFRNIGNQTILEWDQSSRGGPYWFHAVTIVLEKI